MQLSDANTDRYLSARQQVDTFGWRYYPLIQFFEDETDLTEFVFHRTADSNIMKCIHDFKYYQPDSI